MAYDKKKSYGKEKTEPRDYRQELTDKIIAAMETAGEWEKPWLSEKMPTNISTGKTYKGINSVALMVEGYADERFGTYNHWNELETARVKAHKDMASLQSALDANTATPAEFEAGKAKIDKVFEDLTAKGMADKDAPIHVMKGAKGTPVYKAMEVAFGYGPKDGKEKDNEDEREVKTGGPTMWKQVYAGTVFNASQVANINPAQAKIYEHEPHAEAELHAQAMIAKTGLTITNNDGGRAFYSPSSHSITMPQKDKFQPGAYYDTLLHEIGHSTGLKLGRDMTGRFGDAKYAQEELVAELSSVMMSAELGIPHNPAVHENHAAYLKNWASALKEDKNLIFKASSQAQKSADYQNFILLEHKQDLGLIKELAPVATQEQVKPKAPVLDETKAPVHKPKIKNPTLTM